MDYKGLTSEEVKKVISNGKINFVKNQTNQTYIKIFAKNIFTYFNFIFATIAILLIFAGVIRNLTFLPIVIANILIGIIQQIRSKIVLDKLSLLDKSEYYVIRDGVEVKVNSDELVLGDLIKLSSGKQVPADGIVVNGVVLVNESLLTGEADEIEKKCNDELKSGSFIISGEAFVKLIRVGVDSYSAKLMEKAKEMKEQESEMVLSINRIVKFFGIIIIPIGALLFSQAYFINHVSYSESITSTVGAIIGMIPEGMYLLTTVALALSAMRLAKQEVLLHDMRSIETLARVDVLCVDKTGTITESEMTLDNVVFANGINENDYKVIENLFSRYVNTITDTNITMNVLKKKYENGENFRYLKMENFNSKIKYSLIQTNDAIYKFGAPDVLLDKNIYEVNKDIIDSYINDGKRVLVFVREVNSANVPLLFVILVNNIRENAYDIFKYFDEQGVEVKVISGDNPITVSRVAIRAGIKNAEKYIDMNIIDSDSQIDDIVTKYTVFGRVKPEQKKQIISSLRSKKLKVAMTGDGVNDILAMKEADCSIAMGSGSDAARESAKVVLMDSDFAHMKNIVSEGRRDINNITRSATLFLYKNIFSILLSIFSIISVFVYPLSPSQVSLVSAFNIGIPAFLLALEPNEKKQKTRFIKTTILRALPSAITTFIAIVALMKFAELFNLPTEDIGTACTYLLLVGVYIILYRIIRPMNLYRFGVMVVSIVGVVLSVRLFHTLFDITKVSIQSTGLCVLFAIAQASVIRWISLIVDKVDRNAPKITNKFKN